MNEQGLAAQQAGAGQMVEQVVMALRQGVSPDELIAQGVPVEVVQLAMDMLRQQQTPSVNPEREGLAGMSTPQTPLMER